jgi:hypothetical protein
MTRGFLRTRHTKYQMMNYTYQVQLWCMGLLEPVGKPRCGIFRILLRSLDCRHSSSSLARLLQIFVCKDAKRRKPEIFGPVR